MFVSFFLSFLPLVFKSAFGNHGNSIFVYYFGYKEKREMKPHKHTFSLSDVRIDAKDGG